ncbi:hypothetical protein HN51_038897 [Arachis hypogaea]
MRRLTRLCIAIAFYFGARFGFDKADRKRLFNMINEVPTIFEVVTGAAKKQVKEKSSVSNHSGSKSKSNFKAVNIFLLALTHGNHVFFVCACFFEREKLMYVFPVC